MHEEDALRRYALALALVPDADAAGDLFMDGRTEQDLRRRAAAWRRAHGLPALGADPALPALSDEQRRHALHLLRRAQGRRSLRRFLALALALAVLTGAALALRTPGDPVFAGLPQRQAAEHRFAVYRVEATPSAVTVWWSAAADGPALEPELELRALEEHVWISPAATERRVERGRLLAQSTFQRVAGYVGEERVRLGGDGATVLSVPPVWRTEEPGAKSVPVEWQGAGMRITAVTVHPQYTLVGVVPTRTVRLDGGLPSLTVEGPKGPLRFRGSIPAQAPGRPITYVFEGVPTGAHDLLLRPDTTATSEPIRYDLFQDAARLTIVRNNTNIEIVIPTEDAHLSMASAYLVDVEGHRYEAMIFTPQATTQTGTAYQIRLRAEGVPADAQLTTIEGTLLHRNPITIPVHLP